MTRKKNHPSITPDPHEKLAQSDELSIPIKLWDAIVHFRDPLTEPSGLATDPTRRLNVAENATSMQTGIRTSSLAELKKGLSLISTPETNTPPEARGGLKIKKNESPAPSNVKPFVPRKLRPSDETP